jgi:hypothetical protein
MGHRSLSSERTTRYEAPSLTSSLPSSASTKVPMNLFQENSP